MSSGPLLYLTCFLPMLFGALYSTRSPAKGKLSSGKWDRNAFTGMDDAGNLEVQDSQAQVNV